MQLILNFGGNTEQAFKDLCEMTNNSPVELIRKALAMYELIVEEQQKGHEILVDDRHSEMFRRIEEG